MNTRFLTPLTTLVFLGFTVCAFAGPPEKCDPWPSCKPYSGDGSDLYDVTITGLVESKEPNKVNLLWQYNGKSIDYKTFHRSEDSSASLDLTFFVKHFNDLHAGSAGTLCFAGWGDPLHSAGVLKRRKSDAHGKFWFEGYTHHSPGERIKVLYLLIVDGYFTDGLPEDWPENSAVMHLDDWELKVENAGAEIADMSCEDSRYDPDFMTVSVKPSP